MIHVLTPSGSKTYAALGVRTPDGKKAIERASIKTPSGSVDFFMSASAGAGLPLEVSRSVVRTALSTTSSRDVTTPTTTVTVTGGVGPFTYAWTKVSEIGSGGTWSATSPASATTAFRNTNAPPGDEIVAIFKCTVTDARGRTGEVEVTAIITGLGSF